MRNKILKLILTADIKNKYTALVGKKLLNKSNSNLKSAFKVNVVNLKLPNCMNIKM